jgi:hypothetical protein
MPPSELRDDYLLYLDGLELKDPDDPLDAVQPEPARPEAAGHPATGAADEADQPWGPGRYVLAGIGSLVFAVGWTVLSALL